MSVVRVGDFSHGTIYSISRATGYKVADIIAANPNINIHSLTADSIIKLPTENIIGSAVNIDDYGSIYSISRKTGIPVDAIIKANPNIDVNAIPSGAKINLPSMNTSVNETIMKTVNIDDYGTVYQIHRHTGVAVKDIVKANPDLDINNIPPHTNINVPTAKIPKHPATEHPQPPTPAQEVYDDKVDEQRDVEVGNEPKSECECEPVIIIDPGHGDIFNKYLDPGAIAKANGVIYKEKNLALDIGLLLEKFLIQHENFKVFLTRKKDLDDRKRSRIIWRTNILRKHRGDIFISLHLNASTNKKANGFSILTQKNSNNKYSKSLALTVSKNYTLLRNRGIKSERSLGVLRRVENMGRKKSSILIELGFITNKVDRDKIINKKNEIAEQISKGVIKYVKTHKNLYKK